MSGFVALLHRDGRPVDPALLAALTDSLAFRGPDGRATWHRGPTGLGHARFSTHPRRDAEPQPLALDERYWIAGDIRLDAREDLIGALAGAGAKAAHSDAALALLAYRAWGADCVAHLHGDFSFALWDGREQRLFCARDRFGVRPLFHASLGDLLIVSNTLSTLRQHPRVKADLEELALADFLACGFPLDPAISFFRDIRRLPAAHCLLASSATLRIDRYWTLPEEPELRHRRAGDYVEQFADVLSRAVADRTGGGPAGLSLSGGLDSGAIAAAIAGRLGSRPAHPARAYCSGWNCAFEDPEPRAAARTAAALGLPLEVLEAEDCVPLARPASAWVEPEPPGDLFPAPFAASLARMAATTRINLDGQGGDEIFAPETVLDEAGRAPLGRLAVDALQTWMSVRRPPLGLRSRLLPKRAADRVPAYLDGDWQRELALNERLRALASPALTLHGRRPTARARLLRRIWGPYLESFDAGFTGVAIQTRWPFLDERVVRFALSLPPLPWCVDKRLLRLSLRGILPPAITTRRKTALAGDPLERFLAERPDWVADASADTCLGGRVHVDVWRTAPRQPGSAWQYARPVALAQWLQRSGLRAKPFPPPAVGALRSGEPQLAQVCP
jgi:asparagine synthase (glutamine-hydrolysing)